MEKLLLPAFAYSFSEHPKNFFYITVPKGVLPMDVMNQLDQNGIHILPQYGWLTSRARFLTGEEAAEFALKNGLIDKVVKRLSLEEYKGEWA